MRLLTGLIVCWLLVACTKQEANDQEVGEEQATSIDMPVDPDPTTEITTIDWYKGEVAAAFVQAKAQNQPLFLYWGAEWCPPCQEIKATVFKDPRFVAQTQLLLPVYLDGDTDQAQVWGEKFAVKGYPTMILFNADGEELTRIPGGIDIGLYTQALARGLDNNESIEQLLARARANQLQAQEYNRLALYAWGQDNLQIGTDTIAAQLLNFSKQADALGNQFSSLRLFMHYLSYLDGNGSTLSVDEQQQAVKKLQMILSDQQNTIANLDYLSFYVVEILEQITKPGSQRESLQAQWIEQMAVVRELESLSTAERLATWYPAIHSFWMNHPKAEEFPQLGNLLADIESADATTEGDERQSVMHRATRLLEAASAFDDARDYLVAEIPKSKTPFYFMSRMAELEEDQENYPAAVKWLQQAYQDSTGEATRFQWGVEYITGMIRMTPEAKADIENALPGIMDQVSSTNELFAGRNFNRLKRLYQNLEQWDQEGESLQQLIVNLRNQCQQLPAGATIASNNCSQLLGRVQ